MTERQEDEDRRPGKRLPPTEDDECAMCRARLKVYERAWEGMATTAGLLAAANYCGPACEEEAARYPEDVALELRTRPTWAGLGA